MFWHIPKAAGTAFRQHEEMIFQLKTLTALGSATEVARLAHAMNGTSDEAEEERIFRTGRDACHLRLCGKMTGPCPPKMTARLANCIKASTLPFRWCLPACLDSIQSPLLYEARCDKEPNEHAPVQGKRKP